MRYTEFRDAIQIALRQMPEGLTWVDLRDRLGLPYDRPCPTWTRQLEKEIGLSRVKGRARSLVWSVAACRKVIAILCGLIPLLVAAEPSTRDTDLRLPETDILWKAVKAYVEVQPVPEYQHASEEAREAFRDIKYGVCIHWGLYAIKEWKESWTFLTATPAERQAYQLV